jgi:small subunit ribosomal protein S9
MAEDERPDEEGQPQESAPEEAPASEETPAAEAPQDAEAQDADTDADAGAASEEPAPAPEAAAPAEEPAAEAEEPAAEADEPAAEAEAPAQEERPRRERQETPAQPDVVPGAHLEPDLVLDQPSADDDEFARYAGDGEDGDSEAAATVEEEAAPVPRSTIDLAADARYTATGKRKTAIARVIVKPGSGSYTINGRSLEVFFPRQTLQRTARQPLETVGYDTRMDVVARIKGGGVSSQADALRHGISRALVEADPNLRTELKRRGFLTRDAREKERKKAGLKKARKRPQFSKR